MTESGPIEFRCLEVTQPIGTFYIGNIDCKDLIEISSADTLRIEGRDLEKYIGVERPLSPERVRKIGKYVNTMDAAFPTSIILAISARGIIQYDRKSGIMKLERSPDTARILDGQHRIAGLKLFSGAKFELNVAIFIDMDIEDQASVFATINLEQTKVSKSIAYSLYEYARSRSPYKTCHDIAKLLNRKEGSPFLNKIKILGLATPGITTETLTQATFVEKLLPLISEDPVIERDKLKRGEKLEPLPLSETTNRVFINMFRDDQDAAIARILWNYFSAVRQRWEIAWNESRPGNILNRSAGFTALMGLLPIAYRNVGQIGEIVHTEKFYALFQKTYLKDDDFSPERYVPGSKGERLMLRELIDQTGLSQRDI